MRVEDQALAGVVCSSDIEVGNLEDRLVEQLLRCGTHVLDGVEN